MNVSIKRILDLKFLPIIDFESMKNPSALIETLLEQDVPILQINFQNIQQIDNAFIIRDLLKEYPEMKIGAGFFYFAQDAEHLINYGADFVVSSILAKELLTVASLYQKEAIISGFTPTEIFEAHKTKSPLVQIFPAAQIHYKSIISILEYLPDANFILTGGLTVSSALEFLRQGAKAVGVKGAIFQKDFLDKENYKEIGNSILNFKHRVHNNLH